MRVLFICLNLECHCPVTSMDTVKKWYTALLIRPIVNCRLMLIYNFRILRSAAALLNFDLEQITSATFREIKRPIYFKNIFDEITFTQQLNEFCGFVSI